MPRRFPVRFKLTAALAVPTVVLLLLSGSKVLETREAAREADAQAELALSTTGPRSLLRNLQAERNHTGAYLLDAENLVDLPYGSVDEARAEVDESLADFRAEIDSAGGSVQAAYGPAVDAMSVLADLRTDVDDFTGDRGLTNLATTQQVFDGYSGLVNQLFLASRRVSVAIDDPELRRGAEVVNLATRQSDTIALLVRELLLAAVGGEANGVNTRVELTKVESLLTDLQGNETDLRSNARGPYRGYIERLFASAPIQAFPQHVETALEVGTVDITGVLDTAAPGGVFGYDALLDAAADELASKAEELTSDAVRTQNLYTALGGVMAFVVVAVAWLVSRSITRPLRSLTRQATAMASEGLPGAVLDILETPLGEDVSVPKVAPIAITTRDEVGDVATALNTVQSSALGLAVEQAVLRRNIADSFVNLGRRNQNLLGRQLDFITELERSETDPDALASLFRLDHLATRMRRNAESLLVLAGAEPPRKWAAPVRLTDVIRAALSEVEDYHRVTVRSVEPATIVGAAAAGLAHLLAELIENALTFSPPEMNVEIRGRGRPMGYVLAVIDLGFGMPSEEIERANRRLAGTESFTVAPSKYLGHYVTGHLAGRHGIEVRLESSLGTHNGARGITATINLPPTLLTTSPSAALGPAALLRPRPESPAELRTQTPTSPPPFPHTVSPAPLPPSPSPIGPAATPLPAAAGPRDGVASLSPEVVVGPSFPVDGAAAGSPGAAATLVPGAAGAAGAAPSGAAEGTVVAGIAGAPDGFAPLPGPGTEFQRAAPIPARSEVAPWGTAAPPPAEGGATDDAQPPGASAPVRQVGRTPDADLLRTLANYRVETGTYSINSTSYRIDRGSAAPPTELAQRVPGAHLPETEPISLHPRPDPAPPGAPPRGERQLSDEVYAFLAQFNSATSRDDPAP
jgi:signal transduction histidine kinase